MISCYKCEHCGMVFTDYDDAQRHEEKHFIVKTWTDSEDEKVINRETEYEKDLFAPSAVVVPMRRCVYDEKQEKYVDETIYIKYFYSAKKCAEQVFPIDETKLVEG